MDTELLIAFRSVAEHGSFTAAAHALGYTQSAVSRQVAALEAEFDTVLFDRQPRGVRLTEAGRCLLAHAEALDGRLARARQDIAALGDLTAGHLRTGAFPTADSTLLPQAVARFQAEHPAVRLSLSEGLVRDLIQQLHDDRLDVAIVTSSVPGMLDGLELRHIMDDRMFVAMHSDHRFAGRRQVRLAELADEAWIAGQSRLDLTLFGGTPEPAPRIRYVVREWLGKLGFVAAGLGLTLIPSVAASATRTDVVLVPLHPDDSPVRQIFAATIPGRTAPASLPAFLECLDAAAHAIRNGRTPVLCSRD
jgi:DNA-binding transcriptional LysR family regulator